MSPKRPSATSRASPLQISTPFSPSSELAEPTPKRAKRNRDTDTSRVGASTRASADTYDSTRASADSDTRADAGTDNFLAGRTLHILHAKLDPGTIAHLRTLARRAGAVLASTPDDADVIVTGVSMRRRLERHVNWAEAKKKAVVQPAWLEDSVAHQHALPYGDYAALRELRDSTAAVDPLGSSSKSLEFSDTNSGSSKVTTPPAFDPSNVSPFERLACRRACALVCPSQDLCEYLDIIRRGRLVEGEERSALSYGRAITVIKSYPKRISKETQAEAAKLPNIGKKLLKIIDEWLDTGKVDEIETIRNSERFQALTALSSIYGIGPTTARSMYAKGVHSLKDLEVYYDVEAGAPEDLVRIQDDGETHDGKGRGSAPGKEDDEEAWIKISLALRHDFKKKITRSEVERIYSLVNVELGHIQPGCVSTIVGGYRRGKPESNDVDIVFTHSDGSKVAGLAARLVKELHHKGLVTHLIHSIGSRVPSRLQAGHYLDKLEKMFTVFRSPGNDEPARRVDLVFASPESYWTAIVGWTGSGMFERDLRLAAKEKGFKFDSSGITRRRDSKIFHPRSEKEVFDLLELPYIPPEWRNADA